MPCLMKLTQMAMTRLPLRNSMTSGSRSKIVDTPRTTCMGVSIGLGGDEIPQTVFSCRGSHGVGNAALRISSSWCRVSCRRECTPAGIKVSRYQGNYQGIKVSRYQVIKVSRYHSIQSDIASQKPITLTCWSTILEIHFASSLSIKIVPH